MAPQEKRPRPFEKLGNQLTCNLVRHGQSQIAEWLGISQPAVSDWFEGKKRPTLYHLVELVLRFDLDLDEYAKLAGYDVERARALYAQHFLTSFNLESLILHQEYIYKTRIAGRPHLAIEHADDILALILKLLERSKSALKYLNDVHKIRVRILSEKAIAILETCKWYEAVERVQPLTVQMYAIGNSNADASMIAIAESCLSDAFYINRNRVSAIRYAHFGLATLDSLGSSMSGEYLDNRLLIHRTLMVSLALQQEKSGFKDVSEFQKISKSAMKLVDNYEYTNVEAAIAVLEGMSTAQGILKMGATFDTLEKAWNLYNHEQQPNQDKPIFRFIQLSRSGLQSAHHLKIRDTDVLEIDAQAALIPAKEQRYFRYIEQLNALLGNR